jgi:hypothetical protein
MLLIIFIYFFLFFIRRNIINKHQFCVFSNDLLDEFKPENNIKNDNQSEINEHTENKVSFYKILPPGSYPFIENKENTTYDRISYLFHIKKKLDYLNNKNISILNKINLIDKEKTKIIKLNITEGGLYNDWNFKF